MDQDFVKRFEGVRARTVALCDPLELEDYVVQPRAEVSPPKWHLGHTTWFFEKFILEPFLPNFRSYPVSYTHLTLPTSG